MRFTLHLSIDKKVYGNALPLSYQYELAGYIYHTLAKGNEEYANWLHENGFSLEGKQFRLFSFSNLLVDNIGIDTKKGRLLLQSDEAFLQISFLPERSTEEFIKGVFSEQVFAIGDVHSRVQFTVRQVQALPMADFNGELRGRTLSPMCLSTKTDEGKLHYYAPNEALAGQTIVTNLIRKYEAFYQQKYTGSTEFEWKCLSEPKSKLLTMKVGTLQQTKVKAYHCTFLLKADNELLRIGYECGLGEKNSMGFGMVEGEIL